jgi:antitoxin ParD1/3/4
MTIPQDLQRFVEGAVARGAYGSPEEALSTALQLLQEREQKLNALRAELRLGAEQLERGEGIPVADEAAHGAFFDDIERRGQQRLATKREAR